MPRKKTTKKSTAVTKRKPTAVAKGINFESDAGAGLEHADADSFAIPFLVILQKGSPQCDPDSGAAIKGAKPGMLFNTVTGQLFDECLFVPSYFQRAFVEWTPRDSGGGFRGSYPPNDPIVRDARRNSDGFGVLSLDNGNILRDTRYHFGLIVMGPDEYSPAIIAMISTQIKKSRNWLTTMDGIKFVGKNGQRFTPPTFAHVYKLTTVAESNDKGSWRGWRIEMDHAIGDDESNVYMAARDLRDKVKSGVAIVDESAVGADEPEEF